MWRQTFLKMSLFGAIAIAIVDHNACAQSKETRFAEAVVVTMRPVSTVESTVILISDVARIESRDPELKARIEQFDVADALKSGEHATISPALIEFRLRLAGIDVRRLSIRGQSCEVFARDKGLQQLAARNRSPSECRPSDDALVLTRATAMSMASESRSSLRRDTSGSSTSQFRGTTIKAAANESRSMEEMILLSGRRCILEQLPWNEEEVSIRVVQPVGRDLPQLAEQAAGLEFRAERHGAGPPVGRVQVEVTIEGVDRSSVVVPVTFEVRHYDNVVAATKMIPKGREIQSEDLYVHRADVTGSADYCSDPRKLVGTAAKRPIPALQIIREQDAEAIATGQARTGPVVIKRQDRVKMIAKIGELNVTVSGEAQQDGRVGEMIRVLNVESKAIVQGRVIRASEVEIVE